MVGDEGERGPTGLQVLFLFFSFFFFWRRRVSNGREYKNGSKEIIIPLSLQGAGISSIPLYSYALSTDNPY